MIVVLFTVKSTRIIIKSCDRWRIKQENRNANHNSPLLVGTWPDDESLGTVDTETRGNDYCHDE